MGSARWTRTDTAAPGGRWLGIQVIQIERHFTAAEHIFLTFSKAHYPSYRPHLTNARHRGLHSICAEYEQRQGTTLWSGRVSITGQKYREVETVHTLHTSAINFTVSKYHQK